MATLEEARLPKLRDKHLGKENKKVKKVEKLSDKKKK
jgi:hypothetical protein